MRFSVILASGVALLAGCGGDRITVDSVRDAVSYRGARLTVTSATYTPVAGHVVIDETLYNGSDVPLYVDWCFTTLERQATNGDWSRADELLCLDELRVVPPVAPGASSTFSFAWPDTTPGRYYLTVRVFVRGAAGTDVRSPAFTIQ